MLRLSERNKTCFNFTMSISNIAEGIGSYYNSVNRYFALLSMTERDGSTAILLLFFGTSADTRNFVFILR